LKGEAASSFAGRNAVFLHLDASALVIGFVVVAAFAFFFGSVLDAIMQANRFGPTGNTVCFAAGFIGACYLATRYGYDRGDVRLTVALGLGGAFLFFCALALLKAGLSRR
jgi:hypothetical protein